MVHVLRRFPIVSALNLDGKPPIDVEAHGFRVSGVTGLWDLYGRFITTTGALSDPIIAAWLWAEDQKGLARLPAKSKQQPIVVTV